MRLVWSLGGMVRFSTRNSSDGVDMSTHGSYHSPAVFLCKLER
jgi:hypothetical protein